ncbi:MAG: PPC domain-containing protein [Planctomycetota bacterium]
MRVLCRMVLVLALVGGMTQASQAQLQAPVYDECRLDSIFPNGGRRGTTVQVEFRGFGSGLTGPLQVLVEGAPGITIKEMKSVNASVVQASLEIAADARLGRRWLRVLNERSGLTNYAQFLVGSLPELLEVEPNDELGKAQGVAVPLVVNGRINPQADLDVFKFSGKTGQSIVAAIAAHAVDVHGQYKNSGIADFSLELLDATGRTLASAEDTIGFDPIIEFTLPADGDYFVRVQLLNYGGFPEAVYRLTLGDVPYPVSAFPAGYQRGTEPQIELMGPRVPPKSIVTLNSAEQGTVAPFDPAFPLRFVALTNSETSGLDLPILVGDYPEILETEPNDDRMTTAAMKWPITVNGRFLQANDEDWYRIRLEADQKVWIETVGQRFIRSPIDTQIKVFDKDGKLVIENDDEGFDPGYECYHDYKTTDSKVMLHAKTAGDFFVRVSDQNGTSGPTSIYRLTIEEAWPDFRLTHFPDAVPIWGPGTTACVMARIDRFADCQEDIEVSIIGLPTGWKTSPATSLGRIPQRYYNNYQNKVFLSITAPADAPVGTNSPFRIVGRIRPKESPAGTSAAVIALPVKVLDEHISLPLNLFYTSDTGFFRASPMSRVAVAKPQGPWLESITQEFTITPGGSTNLEVRVHGAGDVKEMPITVSLVTNGVASGLATPRNIPIKSGSATVPFTLPPEMPVGVFGITVAQTWRNDIRIGMPGPCTSLIKMTVIPAK